MGLRTLVVLPVRPTTSDEDLHPHEKTTRWNPLAGDPGKAQGYGAEVQFRLSAQDAFDPEG